MLRLGQMPLLTCLVFCLGLGGGAAWKSGWIPIELGAARTGQIDSDESENTPSESPLSQTPQQVVETDATPDDPAIFEQQSEPSTEEMAHPARSTGPNGVTQAQFTAPAGLERSSSAIRPAVSESAPARPIPNAPSPRAATIVQQAGHREPTASTVEPVETASSISAELPAIDELIANGETLAAHRALSKLYWNHKEQRSAVQARLDGTARAIFFQPQPHFVEPYVIEANDQLRVIANKYQLSWEYLARLNKTDPRRIQLGQKLKVMKGPFGAIVDLNDFTLTIHLQGYYVKRYEVGIGKDGSSPLGKFSVLNKVENPQYTGPDGRVISADDPKNPLGERWVDLGDSYGIHGTIEPDSIGKAASRGCIRLGDKDIIEVYDFLVKGSEVVIRK